MILRFTVPGVAKGKESVRKGRYGNEYIPAMTREFMKKVADAYTKAYFFEGAVFMEVNCYFPIPKSYTKKQRLEIAENDYLYTHKPDGDNVLKAIKDALTKEAYEDDRFVVYEHCFRRYAKEGEEPRVEIVLYDRAGGKINAQ